MFIMCMVCGWCMCMCVCIVCVYVCLCVYCRRCLRKRECCREALETKGTRPQIDSSHSPFSLSLASPLPRVSLLNKGLRETDEIC